MIKAPFNFVPLSEKVFFPSWADMISQDIPFADGEDGIIELTIKNLSPLFVRDGHAKNEQTEWSSHIRISNEKKYFIPATTLKGCFRSVLEILSFSKMSRFNDDFFGYRSFTTQVSSGYARKMNKVRCCGWLYQENGKYYVRECTKGITKISHSKLKEFFPDFNVGEDHKTAEIKQMSIGTMDNPYPEIIVDGKRNPVSKYVSDGRYKVVCTGYMNGKNVEYLFSQETHQPKEISEEVIRKFKTIHKFTPYYSGEKNKVGFLKQRLSTGNEIPVFFEKTGEIISNIGITRMFRYPYRYSVKDEVERAQGKFSDARRDLTESIFGYTDSEDPLRGRVQFSHAFCVNSIQDAECQLLEGVFGQPRASFFPFYLSQTDGSVLSYDYNIPIAGRKRYRIVEGRQTVKLSEGNGNELTKTSFRPLPANKKFECRIRVHNLRKAEIGALISAITFHGNDTQKVYHNLGLAKAFGYGCINCQISALKGFKHSQEDYLRAFEDEIVSYMRDEYKDASFTMQTDQSIQMLVKIARATHRREDMEYMQLGEFEQFKESRNFSRLTEEPGNVDLVNMDEVKAYIDRHRAEAIYDEIRRFDLPKDIMDPDVIKDQISKWEYVRTQFESAGLPVSEIDLRLTQLKERLSVLENPTSLEVGTVIDASCTAVKKARIKGYDYDIQLTVPKGINADSIVGKNVEVKIKQISKIGKIVQIEFLNLKEL